MKVILLSDVADLGKKFDLVDVKPGFARNFLAPRGLGEPVTKANARRVAELERRRMEEQARQQARLEHALKAIDKTVITLKKKANSNGHLYAGVTVEELSEEISKAVGVVVPVSHLSLEKAIKEEGDFLVPVEVGEKKATFKVIVEAIKDSADAEEDESSK